MSDPKPPLTLFSIVIPARDEEASLPSTLRDLHAAFVAKNIPHEIVVVDDGSRDQTWAVLQGLRTEIPSLLPVQNLGPHGFGHAVICGLNHMHGDACAIMMADASDAPADAVKYWRLLNEGWDCVFGSRFIKGGQVAGYPRFKLFINRLANFFIRTLFNIPLNDTTNAFKAYRRTVIDGCRPFPRAAFQPHVEIPAQSHVRGLFLDRRAHLLAKPATRRRQIQNQGNGQPLFFHLRLHVAGKAFQPRRLPSQMTCSLRWRKNTLFVAVGCA